MAEGNRIWLDRISTSYGTQPLSEDQTTWGKLASSIQWRRLQLLLLREILVELKKLNQKLLRNKATGQ